MAYQDHDANLIKGALEAVCRGEPRDDLARKALGALDRLVHAHLPEAAATRQLLADGRCGATTRPTIDCDITTDEPRPHRCDRPRHTVGQHRCGGCGVNF